METSATPKRKRLGLWIGGLVVGFLLLLAAAWFVITSNAFFQAVVLPRIGRALQAQVEVADAEIRPFQGIVLRQVRVRPEGREPLLEAAELRVHYAWRELLRGRVELHELALETPKIHLVVDADNRSNLDPLLTAFQAPEAAALTAKPTPTPPPWFRLHRVEVKNGSMRVQKVVSTSESLVAELIDLQLTLQELGNSRTGNLHLASELRAERHHPDTALSGVMAARLETRAEFALNDALQPTQLATEGQLRVDRAAGAWSAWDQIRVHLRGQVEPNHIREATVEFSRGAASLGQLHLQGPLSLLRQEGSLEIGLRGVDARLLNLFGGPLSLDFGPTRLEFRAGLQLAKGGREISASGQWQAAPLQVRRGELLTPETDLECRFAATVDLDGQSFSLTELQLAGRRQEQTWLETTLSAPMHWSWAPNAAASGDAALRLQIQNLDLADWAALLGSTIPAGRVQVQMDLVSQRAGHKLQLTGRGQFHDLAIAWETNRWTALGVDFETRAELTGWQQLTLTNTRVHLAHQGRPVINAELEAQGQLPEKSGQGTVRGTIALPTCAQLLAPMPALEIRTGTLTLVTKLSRQASRLSAEGEARVVGCSGRLGETHLPPLDLLTRFTAALDGPKAELTSLNVQFRPTGQPGGQLTLQGLYRTDQPSLTFTGRLDRLNHLLLRPWLQPWLGETRLLSLELDGNLQGRWEVRGPSRLQAALAVSKLVVQPHSSQNPWDPLAARVEVDLTGTAHQLELHPLQVTLDPTARATNQLTLRGSLQRTEGLPWTGNCELLADSLDLTRYYDLWESLQSATPVSAPKPSGPPAEPGPFNLPVQEFRAQARVGRLYLREVELSGLETSLVLHSNRVRLQRLQARVNGAPLEATADVDLAVRGLRYDIDLRTDGLPMEPWVASFLPERRGQIHGAATVRAVLHGAGLTGASLQQNLRGQANLLVTNLNLSIAQVRSPLLASLLDVVLGLPELIRNPAVTVGHLLAQLTGTGPARSGWTEQLTAAPIQVVRVEARAGEGRVQLTTAEVQSAAFQARATGDIALAADLSQSALNLPVQVDLERGLAERIGLAPAPQQPFTPMPQFLTIRGTLTAPKSEINRMALVGLAAAGGASLLRNLGDATAGQAGNVLGALGQLLGAPTAATNVIPTNAPPRTNPPPGLLDLFRIPPR